MHTANCRWQALCNVGVHYGEGKGELDQKEFWFSSKKDAKVAVFIYRRNEKDFKNRFLKRQKETKACGVSEP